MDFLHVTDHHPLVIFVDPLVELRVSENLRGDVQTERPRLERLLIDELGERHDTHPGQDHEGHLEGPLHLENPVSGP